MSKDETSNEQHRVKAERAREEAEGEREEGEVLPAWIDFGEEMYGIPDIAACGFKIALDRHGPPFDPDTGIVNLLFR